METIRHTNMDYTCRRCGPGIGCNRGMVFLPKKTIP